MLSFRDILEKSNLQPPLLYGVSDRRGFPTLYAEGYLELVFQTSAHMIQWRERDLPLESNRKLVRRGVELSRVTGKLFLVNSLVEIALEEGAAGVHLTSTQNLREAVQARAQSAPDQFLLGQSVHSLDEAKVSDLQGADYVLLGPILEPLSKASQRSPLGLSGLQQVVQALATPVFALGGLDHSNFKSVFEVGVTGVAGISWLQREVEQLRNDRKV